MKAKRIPLAFGFQSRPGRHGQDGSVRMINAYSEEAGDEGKAPLIPYAIDGLRPVLTVPTGPVRAMLPVPNGLFVLAGLSLYRVDREWNPTLVGTVDAPGRAYMARNRRQTDPHIVLVVGDTPALSSAGANV